VFAACVNGPLSATENRENAFDPYPDVLLSFQLALHETQIESSLACEAGGLPAKRAEEFSLGRQPQVASASRSRARDSGRKPENVSAVARVTGSIGSLYVDLGLAPQALCLRLLRRPANTFGARPFQPVSISLISLSGKTLRNSAVPRRICGLPTQRRFQLGALCTKSPSAKKIFSRKDAKAQRKPLETR
jgi:hypothetical protein